MMTSLNFSYHGTEQKSVTNIIEGIDLDQGEAGNEFSDGKGFYVTNGLSEAKEWADHKSNNNSAVLEIGRAHV